MSSLGVGLKPGQHQFDKKYFDDNLCVVWSTEYFEIILLWMHNFPCVLSVNN